MTAALGLLGWAAVLGVGASPVLLRGGWPQRAPRLGVLVWQAASASFVASLVLGGLALAVPVAVFSGGLADLIANCVMAVRDSYRTPAGAGAAGAGLVLAVTVTARVLWCLTGGLYRAARSRREHARGLALIGRRDETLDALVVDHDAARAYCLPGRRAAIVVTTGTVAALDERTLAAVLAHERAHVRARHHLVLAAADALAVAFPAVPLLRDAADMVPRLVEMAADDTAGRHAGRAHVAVALAALAGSTAPAAALPAAGPGALARVQRLLRPSVPLGRVATVAIVTVAFSLLAAPAAAAVAPAWSAEPMPDCRMVMTDVTAP